MWEERKTGEPADLDKIVAEKQKERDLYIDAGFDPSESDSPIEYFLSCQMTVSKCLLSGFFPLLCHAVMLIESASY